MPVPPAEQSKEFLKEKIAHYLEDISEIRGLFFIHDERAEIIDPPDPDYPHYKYRKHYHTAARNIAAEIVGDMAVSNQTILQDCQNYKRFVKHEISQRNDTNKVTKADVERTDSFLSKLQKDLEMELQKIT